MSNTERSRRYRERHQRPADAHTGQLDLNYEARLATANHQIATLKAEIAKLRADLAQSHDHQTAQQARLISTLKWTIRDLEQKLARRRPFTAQRPAGN